MDDLISRKTAIYAAELAIEDVKKVTEEVIKEFKQLPSMSEKAVDSVQ